jgi:hypothetical protein
VANVIPATISGLRFFISYFGSQEAIGKIACHFSREVAVDCFSEAGDSSIGIL